MAVLQVSPGWYWFDFDVSETSKWTAFTERHKGMLLTRKTWQTAQRAAVLFQVTATIVWEMGGKPTAAPKGFATELGDMAQHADPSPGFVVMVEQLTGQAFESFRRVGAKVSGVLDAGGGALKLLLWGGAGILLFSLLSRTSGDE